jgi:hypothetical protein
MFSFFLLFQVFFVLFFFHIHLIMSRVPRFHCSMVSNKDFIETTLTSNIANKVVFATTNLWPSGSKLHIQFLDLPNAIWKPWQKAWIAKIITETIMVYANLEFIFHIDSSTLPNKRCEIRITCDTNSGCYSMVGTESLTVSRQSMNFGWFDAPYSHSFVFNNVSYTTGTGFDYNDQQGGTIIHEFGHALGMLHELQSPFDNPIRWNIPKLREYFMDPKNGNNWSESMIYSNIINSATTNYPKANGSAFDLNSIMKYSLPSFLASNVNNDPNFVENLEQYNSSLSDCDKSWLSKNYPGRNIPVSNVCSLRSFSIPTVVPKPTPTPPKPTPTPPKPTPTPPKPTPTPLKPTPTPLKPTPTPSIKPKLTMSSALLNLNQSSTTLSFALWLIISILLIIAFVYFYKKYSKN